MRQYKGLPASGGIAFGTAWIYRPVHIAVERQVVADPAAEWTRLERALTMTRMQLQALEKRAEESVGSEEAAIFAAHQMFVEDEDLLGMLRDAIQNRRENAEAAVYDGYEHYAQALANLDQDYFKARAQDVRDVRQRVLSCLKGKSIDAAELAQPAIVVAEDLTPSDTIQFDKSKILGIVTVRGGPTSHTAILARSLGIPAVVSVPLTLDDVDANTLMTLDGDSGEVVLGPTLAQLERARQQQQQWQAARAAHLRGAHQPAITRDGHRVEVVANIGNAEEGKDALAQGAEGIGLFRTEFLYLDRETMPSEEEQVASYRPLFRIMEKSPVVVRTLDIGGDKAVNYLGVRAEPNPFLGWRAIRMIRERPDVLETQLRALLRAAGEFDSDLRIMLPMVSSLEEITRAREILETSQKRLAAGNLAVPKRVQFGIMVEVPSAALQAHVLAKHVDFFSIGTNDLTQYTLAVDRTNERVAALASPYHPAVLRLIQMTIQAAHENGKWVGLCGELGGDVLAAPVLLGLGLDEFSMTANAVPALKDAIRHWTCSEAKCVAEQALALPTAIQVIEFLQAQTPR